MAKIILISQDIYDVPNDNAIKAYYAIQRKSYKCIIKDNFELPCTNIKRIKFDCTQGKGQADCLHCAGDFTVE